MIDIKPRYETVEIVTEQTPRRVIYRGPFIGCLEKYASYSIKDMFIIDRSEKTVFVISEDRKLCR